MIDDGGSIALGGLIKDSLRETEQQVPGLGDIPFLGALFRNRSTIKEKTNLMVFIHPTILRDAATTTRMTSSKYNFIRAQQLEAREHGVALMEDDVAPVMPTFEEFMQLPAPFEETQVEPPADETADQP